MKIFVLLFESCESRKWHPREKLKVNSIFHHDNETCETFSIDEHLFYSVEHITFLSSCNVDSIQCDLQLD